MSGPGRPGHPSARNDAFLGAPARAKSQAVAVLLIKIVLVPLLLAAVTWANGKLGPRVAGTLAALPIVAGPAALAIALEQGASFAARAAAATLSGEFSLGVFCVVYSRSCIALGWPVSLLGGWLGYGASSLILSGLNLELRVSLVLALVTPPMIALLTPHPEDASRPRPVPASELGLRMVAGAGLVSAVTGAARVLGTTWSGLLTIFPIATSVLAASTQRSGGPAQTVHLLRGLGLGLYSLTAFFATLAVSLDPFGIPWAFTSAVAAALLTQLLVLGAMALWEGHAARAAA
jgi:hypothetical protein